MILEGLNSSRNVMIPKMQDGETQLRIFVCDGGPELRRARGYPHLSFYLSRITEPVHLVAINAGLLRIRLEQRTDCIVTRNTLDIDHCGLNPFFIDLCAISIFREIALGLSEMLNKISLD